MPVAQHCVIVSFKITQSCPNNISTVTSQPFPQFVSNSLLTQTLHHKDIKNIQLFNSKLLHLLST